MIYAGIKKPHSGNQWTQTAKIEWCVSFILPEFYYFPGQT
jgi:hypothetical protein